VIGRKGGWFQELLVGANKDGWRDRWFGKFFIREGEEHDEWLQKWHKRFLGKCAKFGFTAQPDEASAARNTKLSDELKEKMPEKRAQIDRAQKRERDYREASAPKAPDPGRAARCASEAKQIAEAKAALPQIPAREQAKLLREMAEAEEQYQLECSR
jgi:hypothetical protein